MVEGVFGVAVTLFGWFTALHADGADAYFPLVGINIGGLVRSREFKTVHFTCVPSRLRVAILNCRSKVFVQDTSKGYTTGED